MNKDSEILVTGGAGFIGSHLVEELLKQGCRVTVVDNFSTGSRTNLASSSAQIALIEGDLRTLLDSGRISPERYEAVFHLASNAYIPPSVENPWFDFESNLMNTLALLERMRRARPSPRLVNISTAGVYGNPAKFPIQEDDPTVPISPYGVSKLAAERYVAVYSRLYGVRACSLRLFSVYGPRQRKQVIYDLLSKLRENPKELAVIGDGSQERDFTYVADVVQAGLLVAAKAAAEGEVYNVASGRTCSIAELAERICRARGVDPEIKFTGQLRPGDAQKWVVDISRLTRLGFVPRVSLEAGLQAVSRWFDSVG